MPGCEWRTRNPGEYVAVEAAVTTHLLQDHTVRQMAEALVSGWQYTADGQRSEKDPLKFVPDHHEEKRAPVEPPIQEPRKRRRTGGRKAKYAKTYSQMIRDAFAQHPPGSVLTTSNLREYMGGVTQAIIPVASICATLHKMCEDGEVDHVDTGQWRLHAQDQ